VSGATCHDCPRRCAARGPASFCGVDRPGRVLWRGVTLLEEHEISPTYEIYFTGCSLRCRFCTQPDALYRPREGAWLPPEALAESIAAPEVPPFRAIALVGGDPSVNHPYVEALLPALRARLPDAALALNTNLFFGPERARWYARAFDWVLGDVHFWSPDCAARVAASRAYPAAARAAAEAIAAEAIAAGARLILRILVLPGHLDCCAAPAAAWAAGLGVRVNVMTHYAPAGRARGHKRLGRALSGDEVRRARALLPPGAPRPAASPLPWGRPRRPEHVDPPSPVEIGGDGRILFPFVTGDLLPAAAALSPPGAGVAARAVYLSEAPPHEG